STNSSATSTSVVALASGLEVLAEVPEVDINQVAEGQAVEIVADAFPDQVFQGKVRLIAPAAVEEQNVTSFQVRVALVTGKDKLRSGMNVDLTFLGKQLDQALVVPTVAIVTKEGETGVLVTDAKNQPTFKPVTIGPTIGNQTQVLQGLEAGEKVFVELPENKKLEDFTKPKGEKKS
ncbi:MAG TPA: efflux RND transporter periplasmic adaptor subunit, partial [Candidatus Obscuribacterales bacterium]